MDKMDKMDKTQGVMKEVGSTYVVPSGFLLLCRSLVVFAGRGGGAHVAVGGGRCVVVRLVHHSEALNGLGHLLQGLDSFFLACRLEQGWSVSYSGRCE